MSGACSNIEDLHSQLDLQVNLLTEKKVSKLIDLIEQLRRDLPMVPDRRDAEAEALQTPADAHAVMTAIEATRDGDKRVSGK